MTIEWGSFALVVVVALVVATVVVTLFSLGLRLGDGVGVWRRIATIACFTVCALVVIAGVVVIVPPLRAVVLG